MCYRTAPGLQTNIVEILKCSFKDSTGERNNGCVAFDEMSLKKGIEYCTSLKKVLGPVSKAQVIIIRGLLSSWKQVVFFDYDTPMSRSLLFRIFRVGIKNIYYLKCR